jgi:hypothetical protein
MNFTIRFVEEEDAPFIVGLRNNPKLNKYLNKTSSNIADQVIWIRKYKIKEKNKSEFYFIILENGIRKGLYRLYKINNSSFTIGSWLFDNCEDKSLPILTDLFMCDIGFQKVNKSIMLFDVRIDNNKVINYHNLKKPLLYYEDGTDYWYLLQKNNWDTSKKNVLSYFGISMENYEKFKSLFIDKLLTNK